MDDCLAHEHPDDYNIKNLFNLLYVCFVSNVKILSCAQAVNPNLSAESESLCYLSIFPLPQLNSLL